MIPSIRKYEIFFGIYKKNNLKFNTIEIFDEHIKMKENFVFYDYGLSATIEKLKEFFIKQFEEYNYCKCELSLFYKQNNSYRLLSKYDYIKLSDFIYDELFLLKIKSTCDCKNKITDKSIITKGYPENDLNKLNNEINLKNERLNNEIIELKKQIEKLEKEKILINRNLNNENLELKKKIERLEKINEIKNDNNKNIEKEDFYDIIININSIKNINKKGWNIKFSEIGLEQYLNYKNQELIKIGVLGNKNKGKTFLLSKISKLNLLIESTNQTEGLSLKYQNLKSEKGKQIILLDYALSKNPILKNNDDYTNDYDKEKSIDDEIKQNKEFKEKSRDKKITELFIENCIIKFSDILLLVVGKLNYSEQLLIDKIKVVCKKLNKNMLFIIHNLKKFELIKQVENYIKDTLINCQTFNLTKRTWISNKEDNEIIKEDINNINININEELKFNRNHFTETLYYSQKKLEVFHLIIANEYSEAGEFYNQYAYNFIERVFNLIPEPTTFYIFEQVKNNFKELSKDFLNDKIEKIKL